MDESSIGNPGTGSLCPRDDWAWVDKSGLRDRLGTEAPVPVGLVVYPLANARGSVLEFSGSAFFSNVFSVLSRDSSRLFIIGGEGIPLIKFRFSEPDQKCRCRNRQRYGNPIVRADGRRVQ